MARNETQSRTERGHKGCNRRPAQRSPLTGYQKAAGAPRCRSWLLHPSCFGKAAIHVKKEAVISEGKPLGRCRISEGHTPCIVQVTFLHSYSPHAVNVFT
eukprot:1140778-Pelagomonas_calceolata.AAC.8